MIFTRSILDKINGEKSIPTTIKITTCQPDQGLVELHTWMACIFLEDINVKEETTSTTYFMSIWTHANGQTYLTSQILKMEFLLLELTTQLYCMMVLFTSLVGTMGKPDSMIFLSVNYGTTSTSGSVLWQREQYL